MKTKINVVLILLTCFFSASGFSTPVHNFSPGSTFNIDLLSNETQEIYNFLLWRVSGTCEVLSETTENPLSFTMLANKATLNGVEFNAGQSLYLVASIGQHFDLSAEARAKVSVTNLGTAPIRIHCAQQ